MPEERYIRINKVLREFNISLERAVDFLKDNGYLIEPHPNTKITENEYYILENQFGGTNGKRQVFNKVSEEKRKEKEALRLERELEIEDRLMLDEDWLKNLEAIKSTSHISLGHISFPEHLGLIDTIKLDQYVNLNEDIYENILLFLKALV
jgi:translation initiation factor IF-2